MCWKSFMSWHRHLKIKYLHVWKSEANSLTYSISFFAIKIRLWRISLWVGILDAQIFPHDSCAIKDFGGAAFLEFSTQNHVHWVSDAIQPSHPLSCLSPPTFNLSQRQGLFQWPRSLHQVNKVLEFKLQRQSCWWILRTDLENIRVGSPCGPRDSQESSPTPQFKSINSWCSAFYSTILTSIHDYWKNHSLD